MWFQKVIQIFRIKELRDKILFVLGILVIFRLMAHIPVSGIDVEKMKSLAEGNQAFGLLNLFSGGALDNLSIVMMGLGPYITAVIILQLLTMIFPQLEKLYKEEGESGRQKFNQYGRMATIPLAILQAYTMISLLQRQQIVEPLPGFMLVTALIMVTAGTMLLMWLGELITEKGIGNGVSVLIFAGIISDFPNNLRQLLFTWDPAKIPAYILFFAMAIAIIAGVVLINEGRRNIPVSYAKRVRGMKMYGGVSTFLPLNINPAGVIPIIFALSIMLFPTMVAGFLGGAGGVIGSFAREMGYFFQNPWVNGIFYFILVVLFTFFYTAVTFDPKSVSSNLQKMGGFIPGIRPGESTSKFLYYVLNRVLLIGAVFLGLIAIMPSVIQGVTGVGVFQFLIGGTALLIVVSVVLDIMRQIKSQLEMREYETF
ncbi:MAG: preprotein translocase subunit SecY [Candidatus Pacebacteria bacterium]|nr:preprotein translocase subunit SecY [Candidatus Paceibacterota bacterium]